ncbi:sensor histidine kinase [Mediterraneibacter glycyrrhizinilyticus]|uniref:sensor histidine kinase n=1 Tax=Mediterraneibacter glycyrrhizinilyticus TaxID=342942 RepID=UPI0025A3F745|nr:HAMP domain-containing sensor histidine kinase [Mediterraneibacter glycyrrhizinilyticus]MDM8211439.1 HAMP domain-containing sensor histidine kinase [Mediterraneibacter glycyrrhizinilyticus]
MDTKSKNSRRAGIIVVVVFLSLCSLIMMSQYDGMKYAMDSANSEATEDAESPVPYESALGSISRDLAEGNYLLYNEYANETDPADVLDEYGQRDFDWSKRYFDYEVFDSDGNQLLKNEDEATAENLQANSEEDAGYAFRASYTFSQEGELSSVQIDGTALSPEEEYNLESTYLSSAQEVEYSEEISSIASPENITVIYGMSKENLNAFTEAYSSEYWEYDVEPYESVGETTDYQDTLWSLCYAIAAAALLLPLRRKLDISEMKMFDVPFEVPILVWIFVYATSLDELPARIVDMTVRSTLIPGMGHGMEIIAAVINFAMWFFIFGLLFWGVTSLRAMIRMKGAYWRDRTLTMKLIRHYRGQGTESDEEMVRKAGGIIKRANAFLAKQYDALQHIDFREKTNRTILKIVIINYIILAIVCFFWYYGTLALIIYSVILFLFLRKYVKDLQEKYKLLLKSTNQLAEGHLDAPIEGDIGVFNPIQEELKKIQKGFKKAVDEEVKNERMKTELVTNVSHDLRTPLTAIITYTDLLKNEKDEEKRKEYIDVLERKSLRLKVLIEDLFEISKAASKSVVMHYMKVDIVDLIKQVGLENDSKIKAANLDFRWKLPEHKLVMWLDSQKTYRIFENLIVNITKYAMPHTRVYIEMTEQENDVHISMKNISAAELNFDTEEITDRFVRGDTSRNTEGSGLGLAIAKSFIELQHGTLKITTEADLFKADITLPKLDIPPEEEQVQQDKQ